MAKREVAIPTFDYEGFDPDLKGKLICLTGEINRAKGNHIKAALVMGEAIQTANDLIAEHGRHGRFGEWVERECGISRQTAHNYMNAWERFGKCEFVGQFDDGAMYALAAPKAPQAAADEAKKLAKKGARITFERAKQLLASFRPKPEPTEEPQADCPTVGQSASPAEPPSAEEPEEAAPADDTDFDPAALAAAPHSRVDIDALASPYRVAVRQLNALSAEFEGLASDPKLGVHLGDKITRLKGYLRDAKETISQMEPVCACQSCDGAGCNTCFGSGFWTRAVRGSRKS